MATTTFNLYCYSSPGGLLWQYSFLPAEGATPLAWLDVTGRRYYVVFDPAPAGSMPVIPRKRNEHQYGPRYDEAKWITVDGEPFGGKLQYILRPAPLLSGVKYGQTCANMIEAAEVVKNALTGMIKAAGQTETNCGFGVIHGRTSTLPFVGLGDPPGSRYPEHSGMDLEAYVAEQEAKRNDPARRERTEQMIKQWEANTRTLFGQ